MSPVRRSRADRAWTRASTRTARAPLVVGALAAGAALGAYACIPVPDTSGLPPRDAGADATIILLPPSDAGRDAPTGVDAAPATDAAAKTGRIDGVVIDYAQGAGRGVAPGAIVSVAGASPAITTTTDASGRFTLSGVPAGRALLDVVKATSATEATGVAYGTTQLAVDVAADRTVSAAPVIHEGCFAKLALPVSQPTTVRLQDGCPNRSGAYAAIRIAGDELTRNGAAFTGTARIEMIPLAYPAAQAGADLSWSLGMPGDLRAASGAVEITGATEIRVVDDASGEPLQVAAGRTIGVDVPVFRTAQIGDQLAAWAFDAPSGTWRSGAGTSGTYGLSPQQLPIYSAIVGRLGWWAVAQSRAAAATACVRGSVLANGAPAAGVIVRGVGTDYLGAATAVTASDGTYCLDTKGPGTVQVAAASAPAAGSVLAGSSAPTAAGAGGRSCATPASCTQVAPITLAPIAPACMTARLTFNQAAVTKTLDVDLLVPVTAAQSSAGILDTAYIGQVTPGGDGAACVPGVPGGGVEAVDPPGGLCGSAAARCGTELPSDAKGAQCGGGAAACVDAGELPCLCP